MVLLQSPRFSGQQPIPRRDGEITEAIRRLLAARRGAPIHQPDVVSQHGIVTLRGTANSLLVYDRAEEIVKSVLGVRALVNEIVLQVPDVADPQLRRDVMHALQADPTTRCYHLKAAVLDGRVLLTGSVRGWIDKQLARRAARGVRGVRAVQDELSYVALPTPDDDQLVRQIRETLAWDVRIDDAMIGLSAYHGRVTLNGAVGSAREWSRTIVTAWAAGALGVDAHQLHVAPWLPADELRQDKHVFHNDEEVAQAVRDAFHYDPRVRAFELQVLANAGTVTLSGSVDNLRALRAAEQDALNVVGVWHVHNYLRVQPVAPLTDADIREAIRQAFARDPFLHDHALDAVVLHGHVTLTGAVDTRYEIEHAEDVVSGLNGVVQIQNSLHFPDWRHAAEQASVAVAEPESPRDEQLRHAIETHLQWEPQLNQQKIGVAVKHGRATLRGTVTTWRDRHAATRCALEEGAASVDNQLHVA